VVCRRPWRLRVRRRHPVPNMQRRRCRPPAAVTRRHEGRRRQERVAALTQRRPSSPRTRLLGRVIEGAKLVPFPGFVDPCCPTQHKAPPTGDGWLHEIKHDGYRAQAQLNEDARIFTRRGHDWAARMPAIAAAVSALAERLMGWGGSHVLRSLAARSGPDQPEQGSHVTKGV
jgi:hypothetical protein